jgi:hypothetical protein
MPQYSRTSDPNVVSVLERGDIFLGTRRRQVKGEWRETAFKYKVLYPGVYFAHSGNHVIRCKGRYRKSEHGEAFEIIEHIVINSQCIHKFKFQVGHILQARTEAMKQVKLKPKEFPISVTPKPGTIAQLTEKLRPKKLSELKIKLSNNTNENQNKEES